MAIQTALASTSLLLLFWNVFASSPSFDFVYHGFNESNLVLKGATVVKPSGALRLTNRSHDVIGNAFYPKPIPMFNTSFSSPNSSSFSTYFVFQIVPASDKRGGYGLAFTLSPSPQFLGSQGAHFLGVLNSSNDGNPANHIFMVEFDTVNGFNENSDSDGNHVGINVNSMRSLASKPASYYFDGTDATEELNLESGEPIQAWIDYDGLNKIVNVTVSSLSVPKQGRPLMSQKVDLSPLMNKTMYAGFSAATGKKTSSHYILGWSFRVNGIADSLDLSRLPTIPSEKKPSSASPHVKQALIVIFSVLAFFLLVALISFPLYRRMTRYEVLEDWELDCPHRFRYKDLFTATKGFKVSELIGAGGFGAVYRGTLPGSGVEVAVKKIFNNNSMQGMREFAAEIESLGRLRHKNLVNLQGWCKYKNDLLLVYDFLPNGSLDSLLHNSPKNGLILTWEQRFNILKGIAAGLLYLHEEWEQVVIHRDIKSSNVLIDGDMNARLGDFGLARLYDHGKKSYTTNVVGTIGYIAPELTRTGQASTSTDVYAFGILLLEVACGRAPIVYDPAQGHVILVDWVVEYVQSGKLIDAADPKLNSNYFVEEIELVLGLGLLCSLPRVEARPTMRQVMRYLNADDLLPAFDQFCSDRRTQESASGFLNTISSDSVPRSYRSSSIGEISYSSFTSGR